jgi:hypothetical protein
MGQVLKLLGEDWVANEIRGYERALSRLLTQTPAHITDSTADPDEIFKRCRGYESSYLIGLAELEQVAGHEPQMVRQRFSTAARAWLPVVEAMDFTPRAFQRDGMTPSNARLLEEQFQARIGPSTVGPQYRSAEWTAIPQPDQADTKQAFLAALIARDDEAVQRIAVGYQLLPASQSGRAGGSAWKVLLYLAQGKTEEAAALLAKIPRGYAADPPPERLELLDGLVNRDPRALESGMRLTTTKFKGKWNFKKHEEWYAKRNRSWEHELPRLKNELVGMGWHFARFAVAALSMAHVQGLTTDLAPKGTWSEWVPQKLIENPVGG